MKYVYGPPAPTEAERIAADKRLVDLIERTKPSIDEGHPPPEKADPKRLPVIYLKVNELNEIDVSACFKFGAEAHHLEPGMSIVRYVPEPATCSTCNYYARNGYRHVGTDLTDWDNVCRKFKTADIPQDGTGYCHNHPDREQNPNGPDHPSR